jgi:hypothetical protein
MSSLDSPDAERDFSPVGMASPSFLRQKREIHGEHSPARLHRPPDLLDVLLMTFTFLEEG